MRANSLTTNRTASPTIISTVVFLAFAFASTHQSTAKSSRFPQTAPTQPYATLVTDNGTTALSGGFPVMIETKAKGGNMAAITADEAINSIASDVVIGAASRAVLAAPGVAAIPIIGAAGNLLMHVPLLRQPTATLVYALPNARSSTIVPTTMPKFEVRYGDVVGANPDEFHPVLIAVHPTKNNWRLFSAYKIKENLLKSKSGSMALSFIEDVVPTRATTVSRGIVEIEPQQPLVPGEYALVIRPNSQNYKLPVNDLMNRGGEGLLLDTVWDFSVGPNQ